jgi:tRNA A-37 threonylcarbamoyl transferase component Bud32/tetratricopeptide (TPR) repeat protein
MVGQSLGHFRILRTLGAGGMGVVYAADDTILKRQVAIKVLPPDVASEPERRDRFEREALAIASLNHPAIVTIYSVDLAGDVPFLTMELVEGRPLSEWIPPGGMGLERLLPVAISLADAIATAHEHGVVHRDLKPANVMVTSEGRVKVLDFGLAKLKDARRTSAMESIPTQAVTADGRILGTVAYMSPEQAEGRAVDARTDIFSLGILLYEMAVGERPFGGATNLSILTSILRDTPRPISDRKPELPRDLDRIVRRCLVKDPRGRYQSAADLRNDLEELKQDAAVANGSMVEAETRRAGPSRTSRYLVAAAATVVTLTAASAAGYLLWSRGGPVSPPAPAASPANSSRRVAVTAFENRTGDRSLDSLGTVLAERLIQGLTEAHIGEPLPIPVRTAEVQAGRAGILITGSFDQQGDTLTIQTRVMRGSDGRVLYAPDPVSMPRASVAERLASIHQDVKAFVDMYVTGSDPSVLSRVPVLEAEREHMAGVELFARNPAQALRHFQRALEIDPEFVSPRLFIIASLQAAGKWQEAAAVTAALVEVRNRLSRYEQSWVDSFVAEQAGQHPAALAAMVEAERVAPQDYFVNLSIGAIQLRLNRPAVTLRTFAKMPDPEWVPRLGGQGLRSRFSLAAHHFLGDFEAEHRDAVEARQREPFVAGDAQIRALIGLGRPAEALKIVDELLTMPGAAEAALINAVRELRAHGHREHSLELAMRTLERYRHLPPDVAAAESTQAYLASVLYAAEQWAQSERIAQALAGKSPDSPDYMGLLGAIAARRGDRVRAQSSSESLRRLSRPYLFGNHTRWRARIAALSGEGALAVDLLREAISQGAYFTIEMHRDMDLEPLKDDPGFRELTRPKE